MKPVLFSIVHLGCAAVAFYHLLTGGWLTYGYHLGDANIVNLMITIFELLALATVTAYWLSRSALSYRLLKFAFVGQVIVGLAALGFFLFFMLTWRPKMM